MPRFQLTPQSVDSIKKLFTFLHSVEQLQVEWPKEVSERFADLLRIEYSKLQSIDLPEIAEQYPDWYTALKDELSWVAKSITIIDSGVGRVIVGINPEVLTPSGIPVHQLAFIIENGLADLGIPAYRCFAKSMEQL